MNNVRLNSKIDLGAESHLELSVSLFEKNIKIDFTAPTTHLYTSCLPHVSTLLEKHIPGIFLCDCFNSKNQRFRKECKDTEIAHLFEHVLLEYLYNERLEEDIKKANYSGVTTWDWSKERQGLFHIEINVGLTDVKIFRKAFKKSVRLLKKLFQPELSYMLQAND